MKIQPDVNFWQNEPKFPDGTLILLRKAEQAEAGQQLGELYPLMAMGQPTATSPHLERELGCGFHTDRGGRGRRRASRGWGERFTATNCLSKTRFWQNEAKLCSSFNGGLRPYRPPPALPRLAPPFASRSKRISEKWPSGHWAAFEQAHAAVALGPSRQPLPAKFWPPAQPPRHRRKALLEHAARSPPADWPAGWIFQRRSPHSFCAGCRSSAWIP